MFFIESPSSCVDWFDSTGEFSSFCSLKMQWNKLFHKIRRSPLGDPIAKMNTRRGYISIAGNIGSNRWGFFNHKTLKIIEILSGRKIFREANELFL